MPSEGKNQIRQKVLSRRKKVDPEALAIASELIRVQLFQLPEYRRAKKVHCYIGLPGEVQTDQIIAGCWKDGKEVFLPYQIPAEARLGMGRYLPGDRLTPGAYGVLEPSPDRRDLKTHPSELDLVLVPGVAFDPGGNRIGYGKGYYDKFLNETLKGTNHQRAAFCGPLAIGLALDLQIVPKIPVSSFDIPVGAIVSERVVIRPTPSDVNLH